MTKQTTTIPQITTFGPGSLEQARLTTWVDRHGNRWVRLTATYTIYPGDGSEYDVVIDERDHYNTLAQYVNYEGHTHHEATLDEMAEALAEWGIEAALEGQ
jgi:hypothetical protein